MHKYIHTHTYIHTYIHTHVHTCMHKYIHTHTYMHKYIHIYIHTYIHTHIYTYVHTHTHTHAHACTYIHTYIHSYIHTYIRTLDSLQNSNNHTYLIEEIRKRVATLQGSKWKIEFSWVKTHMGIYGNEITDRLAKDTVRSNDTNIAFSRIPISTLYCELEEESRQQWQKEWSNCTKAAITKQYFPTVQERLNMKIRVTQNIAAMMTGHGKTRAYLHGFKLLENAMCACEQGDQTYSTSALC